MERAFVGKKLGNSQVSLKNAFIRSAAYEGMQHFSHPVIHRGILYQRRGNALMAFQISTFAPH